MVNGALVIVAAVLGLILLKVFRPMPKLSPIVAKLLPQTEALGWHHTPSQGWYAHVARFRGTTPQGTAWRMETQLHGGEEGRAFAGAEVSGGPRWVPYHTTTWTTDDVRADHYILLIGNRAVNLADWLAGECGRVDAATTDENGKRVGRVLAEMAANPSAYRDDAALFAKHGVAENLMQQFFSAAHRWPRESAAPDGRWWTAHVADDRVAEVLLGPETLAALERCARDIRMEAHGTIDPPMKFMVWLGAPNLRIRVQHDISGVESLAAIVELGRTLAEGFRRSGSSS